MPVPDMSVGYPRKGIEYKLVDDVLYIKSPSMLANYHKRQDLYNTALTDDGFFNTKDKFSVDENGFYFFAGRADDMFVSGGENIYPSEVEEIIESHPAIAEAAVIGLPDQIKGTKPYAFVVTTPGLTITEQEVKTFVLENAPAYQHPRRVWVIDQMPLTGSNKINKAELETLAKTYI
jgi:acyl-coenzyme A synthetase/AMP-(fatty) acid ligase